MSLQTFGQEPPYSVEDTLRFQIGGKLYHLEIGPTDSITVIDSKYDGDVREYMFINHNKHSKKHYFLEPEQLDSMYRSYMKNGDIYMRPEHKKTNISEDIEQYTGYWVYLMKRGDKYYIKDNWQSTPSFHISDRTYLMHSIDGLAGSYLYSFTKKPDGSYIAMLSKNDHERAFKSVDPELGVYSIRSMYIAPASRIHNFEIIQYANNTDDDFRFEINRGMRIR